MLQVVSALYATIVARCLSIHSYLLVSIEQYLNFDLDHICLSTSLNTMSMNLPTLFSVVPAQTCYHVTVLSQRLISIDEKLCQVQKPAKLLSSTMIIMT